MAERGLAGYLAAVRGFSSNARLYMWHIVGMDMIHGTWDVLFNLYLLAAGLDIQFIGLRVLVRGVATALGAVPAGYVSDRFGRKLGFILGDGMGAAMALLSITTLNPIVILVAAAVSGFFGVLHGVTEPAFMAENSEPRERVHLFSVGSALSTAAAMIGSLVAGYAGAGAPGTEAAGWASGDKLDTYRLATYLGIALWFASLIPALMLKDRKSDSKGEPIQSAEPASGGAAKGRRRLLGGAVRNPALVAKFVVSSALISLGAGFVLPLFNVFFHQHLHAHEAEIGNTFATGMAFVAIGSLLAPFVVERIGRVPTVVYTRLASVPFILLIGAASDLSSHLAPALSLAGLGYVLRTLLMNVGAPVLEAYTMERLHPAERGTATGLQFLFGNALNAGAGYLGAGMMAHGDYRTPFFLMAGLYLVGTLLFWRFFGMADTAVGQTAQWHHAAAKAKPRVGGVADGAAVPGSE